MHPGGEEWLKLTQGTDITDAFEVHHLTKIPDSLLSKYEVGQINTKRISPYTYEENGFYKTLKRKAIPIIEKVGTEPTK